jgi:hypothetical protein
MSALPAMLLASAPVRAAELDSQIRDRRQPETSRKAGTQAQETFDWLATGGRGFTVPRR